MTSSVSALSSIVATGHQVLPASPPSGRGRCTGEGELAHGRAHSVQRFAGFYMARGWSQPHNCGLILTRKAPGHTSMSISSICPDFLGFAGRGRETGSKAEPWNGPAAGSFGGFGCVADDFPRKDEPFATALQGGLPEAARQTLSLALGRAGARQKGQRASRSRQLRIFSARSSGT